MTAAEFGKKLKSLDFKKVHHGNARGFYTVVMRDGKEYGITCYGGPDMQIKKGTAYAWDLMLQSLAKEFGYTGSIEQFR